MDTEIRKANSNDFELIKRLMLIGLKEDPFAFSVSFSDYEINPDYWWHNYIDPFTHGYSQAMFVAIEDNQIVGMIGIIFDTKERKKHIGSIVWFYVENKYRGRGLGSKLLKQIEEYILSIKTISKLSLLVNSPQREAIRLYNKNGFSQSGILRNELKIDDKFFDVLIMEKLINA
jgi:RimJ/RimL family protein N-acetyltransferase